MKKTIYHGMVVIILILALLCAGCIDGDSTQVDSAGSSAGGMTNSTNAAGKTEQDSQPDETQNTEEQNSTASTVPEDTEPTQPQKPEEPTQPEETVPPSQPGETVPPSQPGETVPPSQPEETVPPSQPEETVPPSQPEETVPSTQPEETEPPTQATEQVPSETDRTETFFLNSNGVFVEADNPGAVQKLIVQYDEQWRERHREGYSLKTGKRVSLEEHTYHANGGQTILTYQFHEDGSFVSGNQIVLNRENRMIAEVSYSAVDVVYGQKEFTYHANGNVASEKYSDTDGTKSSNTYRKNGTLIRTEVDYADGSRYARECNEEGNDVYLLNVDSDGAFTEQTWNNAGRLISEVQQDTDGTQHKFYYNEDGKEYQRYEIAADGTVLKDWRWKYEAGKLTYSVFYNQVNDSTEVWYNEAGIAVQERMINGATGDAECRYFDDQGNCTGSSSHYMEGTKYVTLEYNASGVLTKKILEDWDKSYSVTEYDAAEKEVCTSYYDSKGKLLETVYP